MAQVDMAVDTDLQSKPRFLVLGALGVVYGDIGTSPIYAFREALLAASGHRENADAVQVLGVLSLIIWALVLIVTVKYILFVLRADNRGEGGTLSLMALAEGGRSRKTGFILLAGIIGTSLFFGDALITPAISVLSAVEGIGVITPTFDGYIVPLAVLVLLVLFFVQRFGTGKVASVFGPVMLLWFVAIGLSGLMHIVDQPSVLFAINPYYALDLLVEAPGVTFVTMGAVFLAVTGAEALYADLGHFGRRPIVVAWLSVVFPCLLLCYFGQGAFVLSTGGKVGLPFFEMNKGFMLAPMVVLATLATAIASQSVISGAFSAARQAVQLNLLPRLEIVHTSDARLGQIYMPRVNLLLATGVILLVIGFGHSSALASAYGISVTGSMLMTTGLLYVVMRKNWHWPLWIAIAFVSIFILIDAGFFVSNMLKVVDGGWVSLLISAAVAIVLLTWVRGSAHLFQKTRKSEVPLDFLMRNLEAHSPQIVPGVAVFLTSDPDSAPTSLLHSLKHYKVLHEKNIFLTVVTATQPRVPLDHRVEIEDINPLFMRATVTYGYMEHPNIPRALAMSQQLGWKFDIMVTSFFLSRRTLKASPGSPMPIWQVRLFIALARSAADATEYFRIPTGRVVEIGTQVTV